MPSVTQNLSRFVTLVLTFLWEPGIVGLKLINKDGNIIFSQEVLGDISSVFNKVFAKKVKLLCLTFHINLQRPRECFECYITFFCEMVK